MSPQNTPMSLGEFMRLPESLRHFVQLVDGKLVPLQPESPESQAVYQQVLAALAAGTITDLSLPSSTSDW